MTPMPLQNDIREQVKALVIVANQTFGLSLEVPEVRFDLKGRTAGQCCYHAGRYYIRINTCILERHEDEMRTRTVPHEVAHYVTWHRFGGPAECKRKGVRAHGPEWVQSCRALGMTDLARTHSYTTLPARGGASYQYECGCPGQVHNLSTTLHNKMRRGQQRRCRRCKTLIRPLGTPAPVQAPRAAEKPAPAPSAPLPAGRRLQAHADRDALLASFREHRELHVSDEAARMGVPPAQVRSWIGQLRAKNVNIQTIKGRKGWFELLPGSYK